jgi:hemolysin activation/secretion protein
MNYKSVVQRLGVLASASVLLLSVLPCVKAQSAPPAVGAGALLQQNQTLLTPSEPSRVGSEESDALDRTAAPSPAPLPTLHIERIELSAPLDEPAASSARALFASVEGRNLSFAQIADVRVKLNAMLRKQYGMLVFAVLPQQDASHGTLRFDIVRGHVESVSIRNASRVSDSVLRRIFRADAEQDSASSKSARRLDELQNAAAVVRNLPGVGQVTTVLSTGETEGGTTVRFDVEPESAIDLAAVMDNAGSPATGRYRVGAQLNANSPLGFGDRARLVLFNAPGAVQDEDGRDGMTWVGLASYEVPLGYLGTRGGIQYSRVQYALGGPLQGLGNGYASVVSAYASHPLVLSANDELRIGLMLSEKELLDEFFDYDFRRRSWVATVSLTGTHYRQAWGHPNGLQYGTSLDAGHIRQLDVGLGDPSTQGDFVKWSGNANFTQLLWPGASFQGRWSVQLANTHLDSSEQMSLGGPNAVRAYGYDSPSVDQGGIASFDLSQQLPGLSGLSMKVFFDVGRGQINKTQALVGSGNTWTATGYGIGGTYQYKNYAQIDVSGAFRLGTPAGQQPAHSQTWVSATLKF